MRRQKMNDFWRLNPSSTWVMLALIWLFQLNFLLCWSLNGEGVALLKFKERVVNDPFGALTSWKHDVGESDHCSWFGIECVDGHVVSLNLKNLCLEGTLAPELHNLLHIKSIVLRNNSFCGSIPEEISELKELELLDLRYNKLSGPLPRFGCSIPILLLDNDGLSCHLSDELVKTMMLAEIQAEESHLMGSRHYGQPRVATHPRMLQEDLLKKAEHIIKSAQSSSSSEASPQSQPNSTTESQPKQDKKPINSSPPAPKHDNPPPDGGGSPMPSSRPIDVSPPPHFIHATSPTKGRKAPVVPIVSGVVGGFVVLILVIGIFLWRSNKISTVKPWATGLSGQLQKAFVTGCDRSEGLYSDKQSYVEGITNLKRSELETACEDFSNIIGSSSIGTIYKGTLSNGIEIAVISLSVTSAKDWSRNLETQFRKKIETLSKGNHKNFVNLIGYCEEETPFTRMMVFEYAPNGSLFEHLHVREAEHLDWGKRLRVAMGMAYCLEHMHQLVPPITHPNLNSSAVSLSEDYAAKISDFCFWNEIATAQVQTIGIDGLSSVSTSPESNVYSYGLVLLEMMTGRIPPSVENNSLQIWVLDYLRGVQTLQDLVDPMLREFNLEQLERIDEVIRKCLHPDPPQRPTMKDVAARFKEITGIDRNKATPRLSPSWWEELELVSMESHLTSPT